MDREIRVDLQPGDPSQRFFLHLNALLAERQRSASGTASFADDGSFVSISTGVFDLEGEQRTVEWRVASSQAGGVRSVAVSCRDADAGAVSSFAEEIVRVALANALSNMLSPFFHRRLATYVGPALSGEYWLPGFRFAPALPNDSDRQRIDLERPIVLDFEVSAIDRHQSFVLAAALQAAYLRRLSLLSQIAIEPIAHEWVWVTTESSGTFASERKHRGFFHPSVAAESMPAKGASCPLGTYGGSVAEVYSRTASEPIQLPVETRKILRAAQRAPSPEATAIDACARMYRLSHLMSSYSQSAALAYRVGAIDAVVSATKPRFTSVSDFVRHYCPETAGREYLLEFLHGTIRSAHFHGGAAPLDEPSVVWMHPLMPQEHVARSNLSFEGAYVARRAIGLWMKEIADRETTGNGGDA